MTYRYKRSLTGVLLERKARCALRGDLMVANVHFNPQYTAAHIADKSVVRLLLALTASLQLKIEHFDIKSAFVQKPYKFKKLVYIRQHPRFDGSFKHDGKGGLLIKNLYGGHQVATTTLLERKNGLRPLAFAKAPTTLASFCEL